MLAAALDRGGHLLTNRDKVKLVTVTKLVHRGLMRSEHNPGDGLGWPSRITDEGRVVAGALAWWTTPTAGDASARASR